MVAHRVCFSTHSSLSELERFVKHFAPKKVVPCVVPKRFQERLDQFQETFSALLQRCGVISQEEEEEDVEETDLDDQEDQGGESEEPELEGGKEGGDCEELEQEEGERGSVVSSSRGVKREREEEDREREAREEEDIEREARVEEEDSPWELEDSPRREDNLDDTPDLDELEEIAKAQNYPHHAQQAIRLHKRIRDWQEELRRREVETITID